MRKRSVLFTVMIVMALVAAVYIIRTPICNAARIKLGDNSAQVHALLGEPDVIFESTAELQASDVGPMSYVFTDRLGRSGIAVDELPAVAVRAEWFEYGTAGHLVYYDDHGVTDVLWGGT